MFAVKARRILITTGKTIPFVLCFIVFLAYFETIYALLFKRYLYYWDCTILNTPFSFYIANIFEYDFFVCFITLIISLAIEACKWNLWATFYLFVQLCEKSCFDFEMDIWQIYIITIANLLASSYFSYKGIKILTKTLQKNHGL